jgi:acetoin utilization protein AcuB
MTFMVYGLNAHELMPVRSVIQQSGIKKFDPAVAVRAVEQNAHHHASPSYERQDSATKAYGDVKQLPVDTAVLLAEQIMSAPVVTLTPEASIADALQEFQDHAFRHLPVILPSGELVGMVSERDILRYLASLNADYQTQAPPVDDARVAQLMTPQVLTATVDTDVRYIARLFVEQRIGAIPVVKDAAIQGIICRSDVLSAVMRHYALELWA